MRDKGIGFTKSGEEFNIELSFEKNMWHAVIRNEYGDIESSIIGMTKSDALELFDDYGIVDIQWEDGKKGSIYSNRKKEKGHIMKKNKKTVIEISDEVKIPGTNVILEKGDRIEMLKEEYNGWSNYETWNVNLWVSNDEYFYKQMVDNEGSWDEDSVKEWILSIFPNGTPDFNKSRLNKVNYLELAQTWNMG